MDGRWARLTRLGWILTVAGLILIAIGGFLAGNTDLLGANFESTLAGLASAADRVDDLIIVIGVVTLLVGLFGQNITGDED
jgi:uncharacterized membrane protein